MDLRDFDLSNHYYELAGQFFDEMTVSEKWVYLNNRGNHYYYKKDYQEALVYMRQAADMIANYPQWYLKVISRKSIWAIFIC